MKSLFLTTDILSPSHKIRFKDQKRIRTCCGAFTSIFAVLLCLSGFIFFSRDLFRRTSPISRTVSKATEDSKIFLEDYPLVFTFYTGERQFTSEIIADFELEGLIIDIKLDRESPIVFNKVNIDLCDPNSQTNIPDLTAIEGSFCVDATKQFDANGSLMKEKPYLEKEYPNDASLTLIVSLRKKAHLTDELFFQKYRRLRMKADFGLRYVNVEDYEDPVKTRRYSEINVVDNKVVKSSFIQASRDSIKTDSGLVFEDYSEENYFTFSGVTHEYFLPQADGVVSRMHLTSSNFTNVQTREYIKLQTVLAQLSGFTKVIFIFFKFLVKLAAKHSFYTEQIGSMVTGIKPIQRLNVTNSTTTIKIKATEQSNLTKNSKIPSFWAFYFTSKRKFNLSFTSTEILDSLFDLYNLNRRIQNLEEQFPQGNIRDRSHFVPT